MSLKLWQNTEDRKRNGDIREELETADKTGL
jgi:hypothetical protein